MASSPVPGPCDALLVDPGRTAIFTDFDGTLSPIVSEPGGATPLPGAVELLHRLAERYAVVGVVSGRPVAFLRAQLGDGLWLSGLYGLETFCDGQLVEAPQAGQWRPVVADSADRAMSAFGPATVEPKGLSLTLHFRATPEIGPDIRRWAGEEATRTGLVVRPAKASVELHPPVHADKGTVLEQAVAGLTTACFLGDDVGDLPAFDALDRLRTEGLTTVKVAVATEEAPVELLERADVVVDGPAGALALLERLAGGA